MTKILNLVKTGHIYACDRSIGVTIPSFMTSFYAGTLYYSLPSLPVIVFMAHFIMFDNTETEFRNCIGRKFEYYVERVTWNAYSTINVERDEGLNNKDLAISNNIDAILITVLLHF